MLFHGTEFFSRVIEGASRSKWSHAAIIVRNPSQAVKDAYKVDHYRKQIQELEAKCETIQVSAASLVSNHVPETANASWRNRFKDGLRTKKQTLKQKYQRLRHRHAEQKEVELETQNNTRQTADSKHESDDDSSDDSDSEDESNLSSNNEISVSIDELVQSALEHANATGVKLTDRVAEDDLYMFESDSETFDKRHGGGVQLTPLKFWLYSYWEEYKGKMLMVIRRLTVPGTTGDHHIDYPDFEPFMLSLAGVSYEKSKHDLIGSVLKFNKQDDLSSVFCSELVAAAWKLMGVLGLNAVSSNFLPKDFAVKKKRKNKEIKLLKGATLSDELRVLPDFMMKSLPIKLSTTSTSTAPKP
jgi:hypothetical protein